MIRTICFVALLLGLASESFSQMGKMDTKHVSDRSFCVVRVDIERIKSQLKKSKNDLDFISEALEDELQMDIKDVKVMTLQFGDSDVEDGWPSFAITFEMSKDLDQDRFLSAVREFENFNEATINGKKYLKPESGSGPHIHFESKRKMTVATAGAIEATLNAGSGMGQMSSRLKSAPPNAEIIAVFNRSKDFDSSIGSFLRDFRFSGSPLDVEKLFANGRSGLAFVDLTSSNPIGIQTQYKTEEAAEEVKDGIEKLVTISKAAIPAARALLTESMKAIGDKPRDKMAKRTYQLGLDGLNAADKILEGLKIQRNKKTVNLSVKHMGGLTEIADLVVGGFQVTMLGATASSAEFGAVELDPIDDKPPVKKK